MLIFLNLEEGNREIAFETGYGLEATLPDAICKQIQTQVMLPYLKEAEYGEALEAGLVAVQKRLADPESEEFLSTTASSDDEGNALLGFAIWTAIGLICLGVNHFRRWSAVKIGKNAYQKYMFYEKINPLSLIAYLVFVPYIIIPYLLFINIPWRIEAREGKEVLIIPFYAKSYETFEWRDTEYVFEAVEPQETEGGDNLTLRTLQENETLCYENESRRISSSWIDDTENFTIQVEAKQNGVRSFSVEEDIVFECVVADALVLSSGTSHIRKLQVYSLNTGKELFPIEGYFKGDVTPDKNQTGFTACSYSKNTPTVKWSAEAGRWDEVNKVPAKLFNADFEKTVQEVSPNLFNGMQLAALQKVHVNLKTKKINYLNEYKWSYIE